MRKVTVSRMRERYAQTVLTFRMAYVSFLAVNKARVDKGTPVWSTIILKHVVSDVMYLI